jgi:hypothetical protein
MLLLAFLLLHNHRSIVITFGLVWVPFNRTSELLDAIREVMGPVTRPRSTDISARFVAVFLRTVVIGYLYYKSHGSFHFSIN